jgi:hypothetical protein
VCAGESAETGNGAVDPREDILQEADVGMGVERADAHRQSQDEVDLQTQHELATDDCEHVRRPQAQPRQGQTERGRERHERKVGRVQAAEQDRDHHRHQQAP